MWTDSDNKNETGVTSSRDAGEQLVYASADKESLEMIK